MIVGGGFTGLWAARQALADDPRRDVLIVEAGTSPWVRRGATGVPVGVDHPRCRERASPLPGRGRHAVPPRGRELRGAPPRPRHAASTALRGRRRARRGGRALAGRGAGAYADLLREVGRTSSCSTPPRSAREQVDFAHSTWAASGQRTHEGLVDPARLAWGLARLGAGRWAPGSTSTRRSRASGRTVPWPGRAGARRRCLRGPHLYRPPGGCCWRRTVSGGWWPRSAGPSPRCTTTCSSPSR